MICKLYICAILCTIGSLGHSQLVNIESKRMQTDSIRFALRADLSTRYTDNNGNYIFQIGSSLSTQVKTKNLNKIFFLLGNYNLIRTKDKDFANTWFAHLRYNQQISEVFRIESFIQSQDNQLLEISSRNLLGLGIRLKLIHKKHFRAYLGNAYMYEIEKSVLFNKRFKNHRNSSYFSFSVSTKNDQLNITSTIYFQPLYTSLNDFTLLEQFKVDVKINKYLSMFTLLDYYLDSNTPAEQRQYSFKMKVGLGLKL